MLPDLVSLALFTRVAEMRSITRAAEASHMALAAASRRISMLEHQYGVRLLERTARGTELTSAGRAALYHARQVLSQVDRLRDELQEYAKGRKGHIRLLASASATSQFLPDDLASFSAGAPDVAMTFEEKSSGEIAQALREGTTDVGIIIEGTPMDGLQCREYRTDRLVAVVPKNHPLKGRKVSFSTLLDYDFVGLDDTTAIVRLLSDQAAVAMKPLRLRVQVKAFASQCRMIESGLGVGVLPEGAARPFVGALKLRMLQLADPWAVRKMYVCVRDYDLLPAIARRLVDHLSGT